jgi:DNA-binding response OmpR family regulator
MRILIVEDEKKVARFIKRGLEQEGYAVDVAYDGLEGQHYAEAHDYDAIILDIMLPQKSGLDVLKELKDRDVAAPILLLTARDSIEDRVKGLNLGADDYLSKPFAFEELLARLRALMRRAGYGTAALSFSNLSLDPATRKAKRGDEEVPLTLKEYALLEFLLRNPDRVLTRTVIAEHVWDQSFDSETNVVDVYINHLRNKIDSDASKRLIHTVRGVGYVLKEE